MTAYEAVAAQVLNSTAASVVFSNIPQTHTDLVLIISARESGGAAFQRILFSFNDPAQSTPINSRYLAAWDVGSLVFGAASANSTTNAVSAYGVCQDLNTTANTFGNLEVLFPNYASTSANKSWSWSGVSESAGTALPVLSAGAGLWSSTSAISKLTIATPAPSGFAANSSFFLYGITKA